VPTAEPLRKSVPAPPPLSEQPAVVKMGEELKGPSRKASAGAIAQQQSAAGGPEAPPAQVPAPKDMSARDQAYRPSVIKGGRAGGVEGLSAMAPAPPSAGPHFELPADLPFAELGDSVTVQVLAPSDSMLRRIRLPARSLYPRKTLFLPTGPRPLAPGQYRVRFLFQRPGAAQTETREYRLAIAR
jgi:hypothetical protein